MSEWSLTLSFTLYAWWFIAWFAVGAALYMPLNWIARTQISPRRTMWEQIVSGISPWLLPVRFALLSMLWPLSLWEVTPRWLRRSIVSPKVWPLGLLWYVHRRSAYRYEKWHYERHGKRPPYRPGFSEPREPLPYVEPDVPEPVGLQGGER